MDQRNQWKIELGKRLKAARTESKMSLADVGRRVNKIKQHVSHWEKGRYEITLFDAITVAKTLNIDLVWLATGRQGSKPTQQVRQIRVIAGDSTVPKLTRAQVLLMAEGKLELSQIKDHLGVQSDVGPGAFALYDDDRAMDTRKGEAATWLVVDPRQLGVFKRVCVVLRATDEVLTWAIDGDKVPTCPFVLHPASDLFPPRRVTAAHRPQVLGGVVEMYVLAPTAVMLKVV